MRQTQERVIGGANWTVTQFPASEGLSLLTRLVKIAGPALGAMQAQSEINPGMFIASLSDSLDEHDTVTLIKRLLKDTRKNGKEVLPTFDVEFMGAYWTLFQVLGFVLEVNYGDFFAGVTGGSAEPVAMATPA